MVMSSFNYGNFCPPLLLLILNYLEIVAFTIMIEWVTKWHIEPTFGQNPSLMFDPIFYQKNP